MFNKYIVIGFDNYSIQTIKNHLVLHMSCVVRHSSIFIYTFIFSTEPHLLFTILIYLNRIEIEGCDDNDD